MSTARRLRPHARELAPALAEFLTRQGCPASATEAGIVVAELPHALHEKQAQMELELYVRLWQALQGARVDVLP